MSTPSLAERYPDPDQLGGMYVSGMDIAVRQGEADRELGARIRAGRAGCGGAGRAGRPAGAGRPVLRRHVLGLRDDRAATLAATAGLLAGLGEPHL